MWLTRGQDAKAAYDAGAIYGAVDFVATSPRCVNVEQAQEVMAAAPLLPVCWRVPQSRDIADVVDKARCYHLRRCNCMVMNQQYIDTLRGALP